MNFYDILAAEKWDGGIPTINFFDLLFAQSMGGGEQWETYEGTLPATLNTKSANMRQYQIWGEVGGVGDKTENLFNKNSIEYPAYIRGNGTINRTSGANGYAISDYIPVSVGNYVAHGLQSRGSLPHIAVYDENQELVRTVQIVSNKDLNLTIASNEKYVRLSIRMAEDEYQIAMFTMGATAPETFVPFGYEVDMVSRTRNLFSSIWEQGSINVTTGQNEQSLTRVRTEGYIEVIPNKIYSFSRSIYKEFMNVRFYSSDKSFIGAGSTSTIRLIKGGNESDPMLANQPFCCFEVIDTNIKYMRIGDQSNNLATKYMMVEGEYTQNTMPDYEPYSNTITPIYIGDEPLNKDEYIDYQAGKIYRRTVNEFDKDNAAVYNAYIDYNYSKWIKIESGAKTVKIPCLPQTQYTLSVPSELSVFRIAESANSDIEPTMGSGSAISIITKNNNSKYTFTTAQNTRCLIFQGNGALLDEWFNGLMLVKGDTAPETYTPYLQPTDPPVPLPALPTLEGTTIVDYAGQSIAPEKVYFEYQGGKKP